MSHPQDNFDNARGLLKGTSSMQSTSITLPGGVSAPSIASDSMNFPSVTTPLGSTGKLTPDASVQQSLMGPSTGASASVAQAPTDPLQQAPSPSPSDSMLPGAPSTGAQVYPPPDLSNTSSMSSIPTPVIPSPDRAPPTLDAPVESVTPPPKVAGLSWIRKHRRTILLVVVLCAVAMGIFFYTYHKATTSKAFSGGAGRNLPRDPEILSSKDLVIHLAKGSALELQPAPASASPDYSTLKDTLERLTRQQEKVTQALDELRRSTDGGCDSADGDPEALKRDELKLNRTRSSTPEVVQAAVGAPLTHNAAYSNDSLSKDSKVGRARWMRSPEDNAPRTYGSLHASDIVYSSFGSV